MSCSKAKEKRENTLQGAWILKQYVSPEGYVHPRTEDGKMQCRIYNNDSICYECEMMSSISGSFIRPNNKFGITIINKSKNIEIKTNCVLTERQKDIILAGGLLNYTMSK
jgi:hypothetical protein